MPFLIKALYLLGLSSSWVVYSPNLAPGTVALANQSGQAPGTTPLLSCRRSGVTTVASTSNYDTVAKTLEGKTILSTDPIVIVDVATGKQLFEVSESSMTETATPSPGTDLVIKATFCD